MGSSLTSGSPIPGPRRPSIWTPYFPPLPPAPPPGSQAAGAQRRQGTRAPQNCHRSLLLGVRCHVRRERDKRGSKGSLSPGLPCPTPHHAQPDTEDSPDHTPSEQSDTHTLTHTHTRTEATSKLLPTTRQLRLVTSTMKGHQGILFIVKTEKGINVTFRNSTMLCRNNEDLS